MTIEMLDKMTFVTISVASEMCGMNDKRHRFILKQIKLGTIPFIRIGKDYRVAVLKDDYNEFLKRKGLKNDSVDDS